MRLIAIDAVQLIRPLDFVRRDVPGPVPDVGDLLGLPQPGLIQPDSIFGFHLVRDVPHNIAGPDTAVARHDRGGTHLHIAQPSGLGPDLAPELFVLAFARQFGKLILRTRSLFLRNKVHDVHLQELFPGVAGQLHGLLVHIDVVMSGVDKDDGVDRVLEQVVIPLLAFFKGLFSLRPVRDVEHGAEHPDRSACPVGFYLSARLYGSFGPVPSEDPQIDLVWIFVQEGMIDRGLDLVEIRRMDRVEEQVEGGNRFPGDSEDQIVLIGPEKGMGLRFPLPVPDVRHLLRLAQPCLALVERLFRSLQFLCLGTQQFQLLQQVLSGPVHVIHDCRLPFLSQIATVPGPVHEEFGKAGKRHGTITLCPKQDALSGLGFTLLSGMISHSTQSAMKMSVWCRFCGLRFDAQDNFLPSGENMGKLSNVVLNVMRSSPVPSRLIR